MVVSTQMKPKVVNNLIEKLVSHSNKDLYIHIKVGQI